MSELIDNRAYRLRMLKDVIRGLHRGGSPEAAKAKLKELVGHTDAAEIASMEQELIAEGTPVEEVRSMCDTHAQVLREIMAPPARPEWPPGHPADTLLRENEALRGPIGRMKAAVEQLRQLPPGAPPGPLQLAMRQASNDLMDVDKHYQRKENLLFARLEQHGITGPSKVMWAKDDEARQLLKRVARVLAQPDLSAQELLELADTTIEPALEAVEGMIFKEENILLPMALSTLSDEDWAAIWHDSPRYGWCLVEPREGYQPQAPADPAPPAEVPAERTLAFATGHLTLEQLQGIFSALPVDLTFVDADDRVRFFSESAKRVFVRSKTILGRKVQHCHPPGSVHVVEQILADFRTGRRDVAEFWIHFHGKFVHIRYFAVRGAGRQYLGTLEVTQDLTPLRALEGERRLLQDAPDPRADPVAR